MTTQHRFGALDALLTTLCSASVEAEDFVGTFQPDEASAHLGLLDRLKAIQKEVESLREACGLALEAEEKANWEDGALRWEQIQF